MEPYRPFVDLEACRYLFLHEHGEEELTTRAKKSLLRLPTADVRLGNSVVPLMTAVQRTCASVWEVLAGHQAHIALPKLPPSKELPFVCSRENNILC